MVARPRIVSRASWGARAPRSRSAIRTPTARVFIHHSADDRQGAAAMRSHQNFHMNTQGWTDFAYSFAIGNDGTIFDGRGVGIAGGHTRGHNSTSHGICLLGNFENRHPPAAMVNALVHLLAFGARSGWWHQTIQGHRDASATLCPGRHVQSQLPSIRNRVRSMAAGATPAPPPQPEEEEDMAGVLVRAQDDAAWWLVNAMGRRWITSEMEAATLIFIGQLTGQRNNQPHIWSRNQVRSIAAMPGYRLPAGW